MKGDISIMKMIKVTIFREEKGAELKFHFEKQYTLNIKSNKANDTQNFFVFLLDEVLKSDEIFKFELEDLEADIFSDIAKKYLSNLENEIQKIFEEKPSFKD